MLPAGSAGIVGEDRLSTHPDFDRRADVILRERRSELVRARAVGAPEGSCIGMSEADEARLDQPRSRHGRSFDSRSASV